MLFIHGNPDYSFLYRHQIETLQTRYRCVALDLVGFGLSTPGHRFGFTPSEHVSIVTSLVEHLALHDVTMVVHDRGGPIGLRFGPEL